MKIHFIINATSPALLQQLRESVSLLRGEHLVEVRVTFEKGDATRFARDAASSGADLVICAGGDGTVNEAVNGLLQSPDREDAADLPRLGIVPLGTGNDFAASVGIPDEVEEAIQVALNGRVRTVDVGVLNGRYFLNVSSGGLGAEATEETSATAKNLLGAAAYLVTGVRTFAALEPSHGRFTSGGEVLFEGPFLFFSVGNGARAGGGNWITPRADLTDGLLDLCVVGAMSRTELLRILPELRNGDHLNNPHVIYHQLSDLQIESFGELYINADGEAVDSSVLEYSVLPRSLRVTTGDTRTPGT